MSSSISIRTADIEAANLITALETANAALSEDGRFRYLMADYWNSEGLFAEYSEGLKQLRQEDCINGSAFGETAELRWRKMRSKLRVVLFAEADLSRLPQDISGVPWEDHQDQAERCGDPEERRVLLWGTKHIGDCQWVEARIPRKLTYPDSPDADSTFDHVILHYLEYCDDRGRPVIQRRRSVSAHTEP